MLLKFDGLWVNTSEVVAVRPLQNMAESRIELSSGIAVDVRGTPDEIVLKLKDYDANCR